jgi:hypothetical protein
MFLKNLVGRTDIENALQRLENMTLEETRTTGAETLIAVHGIGDSMHDIRDALQATQDKIEGMLQGVTDMLQGVDDKVKSIGDKVINSA